MLKANSLAKHESDNWPDFLPDPPAPADILRAAGDEPRDGREAALPPPAELPTTMTHGLRYEIVQRVREGGIEGRGRGGQRSDDARGCLGLALGQPSFDTWLML